MLTFTLLLFTLVSSSSAFRSSSLSKQQQSLNKFPSQFNGQEFPSQQRMILGDDFSMESKDDVHFLFSKAMDCAYDGECSVDDASHFLHDLTFLLSQFGTGKKRNQNALCEQQDVASDVVARLRMRPSSSASSKGDVAVAKAEEERCVSTHLFMDVIYRLTVLLIPLSPTHSLSRL